MRNACEWWNFLTISNYDRWLTFSEESVSIPLLFANVPERALEKLVHARVGESVTATTQ
jgi:hypothetical protein